MVSRALAPQIMLTLDLVLALLLFGAGTAIAVCRQTLPEVNMPDFCANNGDFCRKAEAAAAFSFLACLAILPSLYVNAVPNAAGPW